MCSWPPRSRSRRSIEMGAQEQGTQRIWALAIGGAVVVAAVMAALFSALRPPAIVPLPPRTRPVIELAERRAKSALDDEATLLDPTPLFQPTQWNTARKDVPQPELGGAFQSYRVPAKLG